MIDRDLKIGDLALYIEESIMVVKILELTDGKDTWYSQLEDISTGEKFWIGYNKHRTSEIKPFTLTKHIHQTG